MKRARKALFNPTMVAFALALIMAASAMSITKGTPFKGRGQGQLTSLVPGPDGLRITAVGSGNSTHLGSFTRNEQILLDPVTGAITGTIVFTAANGDEVWCGFTGGFTGPATAEGTYSITGGTGRFAGASGSADFTIVQSDPANFSFKFNGTIDR